MSSIVLTAVGSEPSPAAQAPLDHVSVSGAAPSAIPASRCALSRIFAVALAIAAGGVAVGRWKGVGGAAARHPREKLRLVADLRRGACDRRRRAVGRARVE